MRNPSGWDSEEDCDYSFESKRNGIDLICYVALPAFYLVKSIKYIAGIPAKIGNSLVRKEFSKVSRLEDKDLD